jgi:ATP-dependent DNA helicase RecQ
MRRQFIEQEDSAPDHKRREHKRLDALISYCEAPECRRQALLAYFGEARSSAAGCGNCDICMDPPEMVDGTADAKKLLSVVVDTGQVFGQAHVIDVVRGAKTEKVRSAGHDALPTYGTGEDLSKNTWRSIVRQLVAAGFLDLDVAGYGGLRLAEKGAALLAGDACFSYRKDVIKQKAAKKGRRARAAVPDDLSPEQIALLARLKDKRTELARERGVPAYIIFSDRSLEDMARKRPRDSSEFADVHGVGAAKLKDLADAFVSVIALDG